MNTNGHEEFLAMALFAVGPSFAILLRGSYEETGYGGQESYCACCGVPAIFSQGAFLFREVLF
jgi:hypothetical protein